MRMNRELIDDQVPAFGSRLALAMTYRQLGDSELTQRLHQFGLEPGANYLYRLTSTKTPANPTLLTLAGLRAALQVSGEWWFDPRLTGANLPSLDLER